MIKIIVTVLLLATGLAAQVQCYAVRPSGDSRTTNSGADWNNSCNDFNATTNSAQCKPGTLTRGAIYYVAGSANPYQASTTFQTPNTDASTITIKKATDADHGQSAAICSNSANMATGWVNSGAMTGQAQWINSSNNKVTDNGGMWKFCAVSGSTSDHWIIDGVTGDGTSNNAGAGGQYGFYLQTNGKTTGVIKINGPECGGSGVAGKDITFGHIEMNGIDASGPCPATIVSLSSSGTTATAQTNTSIGTGTCFQYQTASQRISVSGVATSGYNTTTGKQGWLLTGVDSTGTVTCTPSGASHCFTFTTSGSNLAADSSGGTATSGYWYFNSGSQAVTLNGSVGPYSFQYIYSHDLSYSLIPNSSNVTIDHVWIARNYSSSFQHANGISSNNSSTSYSNWVISNSTFEDISGTANIIRLGNAGVWDSVQVYNNLFYSTDSFETTVGVSGEPHGTSKIIGDNNGSPASNVTNLSFYNNTIANKYGPGHANVGAVLQYSSLTGTSFQNNLWFGNGTNTVTLPGTSAQHDYNSFLNSAPNFSLATNERSTASGSTWPFVATQGSVAENANFKLANNSDSNIKGANTSSPFNAAPYNVDASGSSYAADSTRDRGFSQFQVAAGTYTVAAACAGNGNSTIVGSAGSTMNAVCTAGVLSGSVTSESITAGASVTYTITATSGTITSISGGGCTSSPCTITINTPVTLTVSTSITPTCSLASSSNNLNYGQTVTLTPTLTNLSGTWSWWITAPDGSAIIFCSNSNVSCHANGDAITPTLSQSGQYTLYSYNGVICPSPSTQPLNVSFSKSSTAH